MRVIRAPGLRRCRVAHAALGIMMILFVGTPARALQVIEAADHAELAAEVSSSAVNRIALEGDRVTRVIQAPGGFTVEHDPVRGDLYLHPGGAPGGWVGDSGFRGAPARALYLGTERGFTYRLALMAVPRDSVQILIRNPALEADAPARDAQPSVYTDELVALVRAAAGRSPMAGYAIEPGPVYSDPAAAGLVEVWRGLQFTVRVFRLTDVAVSDASSLGERAGPGVAAAWVSSGDAGSGERLAVVVERGRPAP